MSIKTAMKKWILLVLLSLSMFVVVLDTTVMNVSISALVADLGTTVTGIQSAISLYALVMASFMLIGSTLADRWGKKRTFLIGIGIFGVGTFSASLSTSLTTLILGWSVLEGLGSALMVPNIQNLLRDRYRGKDLAFAYGIISAVGAVGAALGPILGGYLTTFHSWRWAFRLEVLVVIIVLVLSQYIPSSRPRQPARFDGLGAILSILGLSTVVLSILMAQPYGFWIAKQPLMIGALAIAPLGLSVVPFMLGGGILILMLLVLWERHLERQGHGGLFKPSLFLTQGLPSGFAVRIAHMGLMAAFFFIVPLLLQLTFEFTAMQTGLALLPLSIAILIFAIAGAQLAGRFRAKRIIQVGYVLVILGLIQLLATVRIETTPSQLAHGIVFGIGSGLIASQILNLILSSVDEANTTATAGLNATFEQLGNAIGVALVGTIMVGTLISGLQQRVMASPDIPAASKPAIIESLQTRVQLVSDTQLAQALDQATAAPDLSEQVELAYRTERLRAFRSGMVFLVFLALVGLVLTPGLPNLKLGSP
ncbi:MAG: MFS transporter [Leptolyngbya sp. LCM1.Bin17]|nr:MAG: MFS transporter [Leptolyngbya sp. LCM1.Bin17]